MRPLNPEGVERLRRMGGPEFVHRMIDVYLEDAPARVAAAIDARERRDLEALVQAAHALVASSGRLGGEELADVARRIEEAGRRQEDAEAFGLVEQLSVEFEHVRQLLSSMRSGKMGS